MHSRLWQLAPKSTYSYTTKERKCRTLTASRVPGAKVKELTAKQIGFLVLNGTDKTKIPQDSFPSTAPRAASVLPAAAVPLAWLAEALPQGSVSGLKV